MTPLTRLQGLTIVVTRPDSSSDGLVSAIEKMGGIPVRLPLIEVVSPSDGGRALASALEHVTSYEWVVFTSASAVEPVIRLIRTPLSASIAAVGPGTAEALKEAGVPVSLVPPEFVAESLVEAFPSGDGRVLLPQAAGARNVVRRGLEAKGWVVDVVEAYRTSRTQPSRKAIEAASAADWITFASSSAVRHFLDLGIETTSTAVACIGPVTAATAMEGGLNVVVTAPEHTANGLLQAIVRHVERSAGGHRLS